MLRQNHNKKPKSPSMDICNFSGSNGWFLDGDLTHNECQRWKR